MQLSDNFGCTKGCTCGATGCPGSTTIYYSNSNYDSNSNYKDVVEDNRAEWEKIKDELKSLRWKRRQDSNPGCPSRNINPKTTIVVQREKTWIARVLNCARQ